MIIYNHYLKRLIVLAKKEDVQKKGLHLFAWPLTSTSPNAVLLLSVLFNYYDFVALSERSLKSRELERTI